MSLDDFYGADEIKGTLKIIYVDGHQTIKDI